MSKVHPSIGPHEGRELELMLSGEKPLTLITAYSPDLPAEFDPYIASGRLFRTNGKVTHTASSGKRTYRMVISHTPDDPNISKLLTLVMLNGFDPDIERAVGKLLGYKAEDVEYYIGHYQKMMDIYPQARRNPIPNAQQLLAELGF